VDDVIRGKEASAGGATSDPSRMLRLREEDLREAVQLLRDLLRFDTTNPPGNERPAAEYVAGVLAREGLQPVLVDCGDGRASVVARLAGSGAARPILLSSHLDVVPAEAGAWTHPPFEAVEADGCVWGRGAIDMKGMTAMGITVLRHLVRNRVRLERDLIIAAVSDEEAGCEHGSRLLVERHPELVDAEYVINEVGGFSLEVEGRRFYPVQVAEKGVARLEVRVRGEPGHGSLPAPDSAVARLGVALQKLAGSRFAIHPTMAAREFLDRTADASGFPASCALRALKRPAAAGVILSTLVRRPDQRASLQAMLCNTVNPTIVRAGDKLNVVPGEARIDVDGRLLPGQSGADLAAEVRGLLGPGYEVSVEWEEEASEFPWDTSLFDTISAVMKERDPDGTVVPYLLPGFTDSKSYKKLGACCYGFYPVRLPPDIVFSKLFHGTDERIPVDGFRFGIEVLYDLLVRFAGDSA